MDYLFCNVIDYYRSPRPRIYVSSSTIGWIYIVWSGKSLAASNCFINVIGGPSPFRHLI